MSNKNIRLPFVFFIFIAGLIIGSFFITPHLTPYIKVLLQSEARLREKEKLKETSLTERDINEVTLDKYYRIAPSYLSSHPESFMKINSLDDLVQSRNKLIQLVWGSNFLPHQLILIPGNPPSPANKAYPLPWPDFKTKMLFLKGTMEPGITSEVVILYPRTPGTPKQAMILHRGHHDTLSNYKDTIQYFLDHGIMVAVMNMPLTGDNSQPEISMPRGGTLKLTLHDQLKFLDHPLQYFVSPVVALVDYLNQKENIQDIAMMGIEGGGWTTTMASAMDTRIRRSYPISGSYPLYLRSGADQDWGDFEQTYPPLIELVDYLDLYLMGADQGRKQMQIINQFHDCCFAGFKYQTYEKTLMDRAQKLGNNMELFLDDTSLDYNLSPLIMAVIANDMSTPSTP